jgi:hypothetical protein
MKSLVQRKDSDTWNAQESEETPAGTLTSRELRRESERDAWDRTDRLFHFPARLDRVHRVREGSSTQARSNNPARARWLEAHDVHTQFVDAGIGCCWFAQQGDQEPVSGETEDEAIARLARANGVELWRQL